MRFKNKELNVTLRILSQQEVMQTLNEIYPVERLAPITQMLTHQFQTQMTQNECLNLSGQKGDQSYYLKIELLQTNDQGTAFEFFMTTVPDLDIVHGYPVPLLDFVGHVLNSFFEEEREARLPLDFTPFQVTKYDVYGRQEYRDYNLERQAEAWLTKTPED
jgi:hypothetical protein